MRYLILLTLIVCAVSPVSASPPWLDEQLFGTTPVEVRRGTITINNDADNPVFTEDSTVNQVDRGNLFSATTGVELLVGAGDRPVYMLVNPSTSTKIFKTDLFSISSLDSGVSIIFRFHINPTVISSGTTLTIGNNNTAFAFKDGEAEVYLNPIVSDDGPVILVFQVRDTPLFFESNQRLVLVPGTVLLMTAEPSAGNKLYSFTLGFLEVDP